MKDREKKRASILVIDDEPGIGNFFRKFLSKEGYLVRTAESALESIKLIKESPSDVVLLDLKMPELDGPQIYRKMRKIRPDMKVIVITAYADAAPELVEEAVELGAKAVIKKPFKIDEVLDTIERIVGEKR